MFIVICLLRDGLALFRLLAWLFVCCDVVVVWFGIANC